MEITNFITFFAQGLLLDSGQESVKNTLDSLKASRTEAIAQQVENLSNMNADEIIKLLLEQSVKIGLKVLAAVAIYIIGAWLIRKFKKIIRKVMEKRGIDPSITSFTMSFLTIVLTFMLILMTVDTLGINTSSIVALLAGSGLAIGMALSGSLQNFAGGIMILIFKPFRVGDYVGFQNISGTIQSIEMTSTFILADNGETVVLPNGTIFNGTIINHSRLSVKRVVWNVSVAYGTDVERARRVALELLNSHPDVIKEENPPVVFLSSLNESAIIISIRCWVPQPKYWSIFFWGNEAIYNKFRQEGIQFPYPQLDVHLSQN